MEEKFVKLNLDDLFGDKPKEEKKETAAKVDNSPNATELVQREEKGTKTTNKSEKVKKANIKETKAKNGNTKIDRKYKYPFQVYLAGRMLDVTHIFEENQEYTSEEINKKMLEHRYYEFAGQTTYDYIEADNVLVPTFQQHKKG